ncbi:MAG: zinc ABC transporter substrate-binding protein [Caldilineaceae bacterium]|nr:zinc ABC transporter substrate-binding protein [Caldilineaceae bacterium]
MWRWGVKTSVWVLLALLLTACGGNERADDGKLDVVTTIGQLTNVVEIVGGEHVNVTGLMGPGVDPHLYVASESDVESLQNADVIIYNGLFLEAQMTEVFEALGERKTVLAAGEQIDSARLLPWADYADEYDPHIWFDVTLWMEVVKAVRDTLSTVDAANAADYAANADALLQELGELHEYVQSQAARVPDEQRVLVTAHDAFHYFGRTYGFDVRGLQGISTASEAGTADVQQLADFIVEHEIPAIFIESSVPIRNVEALQAAVAAKGHQVEIGGELFSDAMGDPGTPEGTYVGMVRHNVDTIVAALLGE